MTAFYSRSAVAASPWGLLLSVCLHGLAFLAVISLAFPLSKVNKPVVEAISHVKLVESNIRPPVAEQIQAGPTESANPRLPKVLTQTAQHDKSPDKPRATIEARSISPPKRNIIAMKKRRRLLRRVEAAKEPARKKPEVKTAKSTESPQSYLEKSLAAIRQKVDSKKAEAGPSQISQPPALHGEKNSASSVDENDVRWFNSVRTSINSHWSILGDDRRLERVTIIGVRIADNGSLADASVDESSGDRVFDRSAMRAVFQAAPFPPVPSGVKERISKAGGLAFRFTPKGMQ
ncbi:MAG: TonB family protein [Desulfomonilaceae bacterium]